MVDANFTLVQLRYFLAAAEAGSMTGASRQMMVSQSAISTAVAHLEKELGVQLAIRHHASGLTLTNAGRSFVAELRGFLAHADDLTEAARGLGRSVVGELVVGCFSTIAPFYLPRLLSAFEADCPEVRVHVVEDEHSRLYAALRDGDCDLVLSYGYDLEPDITYDVLDRVPPYVLVGDSHPLSKRRQVRLSELIDDPMVLLDLPHSRDYFRNVIASAGLQPNVRRKSVSFETVRALVANGQGWSLLNQRPKADLTYDGSKVNVLKLKDDVPPLDVVLARLDGVRPTRRAVAFTSCARQHLKNR